MRDNGRPDPEPADQALLSGAVGGLVSDRNDGGLPDFAIPLILDGHGLASPRTDEFGNAREVAHGLPVDFDQPVPDFQACSLGRTVGHEAADDGGQELVHAQFAVAQRIVVSVRPFTKLRDDLALQQLSITAVFDGHRLRPIEKLRPLDILVAVDISIGQANDFIPGTQAGPGCGAVGLNRDDRRRIGLSGDEENGREDDDCEKQIRNRAAQNDSGARIQRLREKGATLLLVGQGHVRRRGAGRIVVAQELHIATQRDGRHFPARAPAVGPADKLGAKADREDLGVDAKPARDPVMPELVNEHEQGEHQDEIRQVSREQANDALHGSPNHRRHVFSIG